MKVWAIWYFPDDPAVQQRVTRAREAAATPVRRGTLCRMLR